MNAALAWNTLALQWLQMMAASQQAIAHRASRGNTPAQIFEMGSEKALAAVESSAAMARHMASFPASGGLSMWNAWARMLASGMTPYRVRAVANARAARKRR
jgi:hypothetical protein